MRDEEKSKDLLIRELLELRQRNAESERREKEARKEAEAARAELAVTRVRTEEAIKALAESEKRYRMMGEAVPFGVWWCNAEGEAEYVSPSFLELLNMTLEEQQGFGWTKRLVPEDVEPFFEKWRSCLTTGESWDSEHRIIDRHGAVHTVLTRGLPVRDDGGDIFAWVGVNLDITARKRMEIELKQAKEELEKALTAKDQFMANISHELRTPLALILGPVKKMLEADDLSAEEMRDLKTVERNARTLLKHVNDLLDLSKLQVGKMEADYAAIDLAWLVRVVASLFESVAAERRIQFEVVTPPRLPAQVDPDKIQRVLLNLLSNAFKFTPEGGRIEVRLQSGDVTAVLSVGDSGPGIPPDRGEVVFERFRQLDAGSARQYGGTGLGLSIVKEFVSLHHGEVRVGDSPHSGALFSVELPVLAPAGASVRTQPDELDSELSRQALDELRPRGRSIRASAARSPHAPLVLVVEDNPDMCAYLSEAIGREYRVETAADGREGLSKALELRPDLILSDIMMPHMSGDRMVGEIRRHRELDTTPIVLLTAKADDNLRETLLRDAVQDYIHKPFSSSEVLARVARLIGDRRRNEAEIAKAYTLLRAVTEGVEEAIFVKDLEGNYLMINQAGARRFGKGSADEVVGRNDREFFPPELTEKVKSRDREIVEKGKLQTYEEVLPVLGTERIFVTSKAPYRDPQGQSIGIIGISHDITERKQTETELRRLKNGLEERVKQRTAELALANRELEAFSYSVSHDLRAPLRQIDGFVMLLEKTSGAALEDKGRRYVQLISDAARRMGRLIDDLLVFSRVGRVPMAEASVSLEKLVDEARQELAPDTAGRAIDWNMGPLPEVRGDPTLLRSVVVNLLSNAVKFTRNRNPARIEIGSFKQEDDRVVCFVRDNGAGFDMRFVERLFGVFQRLHRPEDFEGTGIGLANARRIIERHGGKIWAEGAVERGATFFFSLPGR